MKIAVIGNSHIGALKRGADMIAPQDMPHDLRYFGARSNGLQDLQIDGTSLVPASQEIANAIAFTSGGETRIETEAYDAFLLYGMEARPFFAPIDHFYSSAVLARALKDVFEGSLSHLILGRLRAITTKPIYVGHNPLKGAQENQGSQDSSAYHQGLILLNETVYAAVKATILPQPSDTIVNGNGSAISFAQGSKRLAIGDNHDDALHPDMDLNHMNDLFGSLWLKAFFAQIA